MRFRIISESRGGITARGTQSASRREYSARDALANFSSGDKWAEEVDTGKRYDKEALARLVERARLKKPGI